MIWTIHFEERIPKELSLEEVRQRMLNSFASAADYWAAQQGKTVVEKIDGAIFSVLAALEGSMIGLPVFDISPSPHPDDREFLKKNGEDWVPRRRERQRWRTALTMGAEAAWTPRNGPIARLIC